VQNLLQPKFREVLAKLRTTVTDIQALILVGPEGVIDYTLDDTSLNLETIAGEYATLLHIARSASQDSGSGSLVENIVVSEKSIMIARTVTSEHYLILLARSQNQLGRARYELKQAAWELQRASGSS
jgi:predicted regulator of Ras-like GTPase activity (Roadblock/LC7/MglB family)